MDGGAWEATVCGVAKSWTWLSDFPYSLTHLVLQDIQLPTKVIWNSSIQQFDLESVMFMFQPTDFLRRVFSFLEMKQYFEVICLIHSFHRWWNCRPEK